MATVLQALTQPYYFEILLTFMYYLLSINVTNSIDSVLFSKKMFLFLFFTLDKSRDTELQICISYTAVEEQWESNSTLKGDKLVTPRLRKCPLNVLVHLLES